MILPEVLDSGPTRYDVAIVTGDAGDRVDRVRSRAARRRRRPRRPGPLPTPSTTATQARELVDDSKVDVAVARRALHRW